MSAGAAPTLGFLGGTGPHGLGLAGRLASAGYPVVVGSRQVERAEEAVRELQDALPSVSLAAADNRQAAERSDLVFVTVPYDAQDRLLEPLGDAIGTKVLISCANPLRFDRSGPAPVRVEDGSAAQECQRLLPRARVVSAFQNVSAVKLRAFGEAVSGDVLLCGDDDDAKSAVAALVRAIPALAPVDAGPLRLSGVVEDLTAVLLSVNRRYKSHAGVGLTGIDVGKRAARFGDAAAAGRP